MTASPALSFSSTSTCDAPPRAVSEANSSLSFYRRPGVRQRVLDLADQLGADTMQDVELLLLQFAPADRRKGVALAERLIERFGGLAGVLAADRVELLRHVRRQTLVNFKILREVASRLSYAAMAKRPILTSYGAVSDYLRIQLRGLAHEEFWVVFLDKKNQLILAERQSRGTVDHTPVYVREVISRALQCGASALVLAHNHPTGDPEPSRPDIEMTKLIVEAGKALKIAVHDHLIVGAQTITSFKAMGLF